MQSKFAIVMTVFAVLAIIAAIILRDKFRLVVLIFLGGLALKTLIARKAGW